MSCVPGGLTFFSRSLRPVPTAGTTGASAKEQASWWAGVADYLTGLLAVAVVGMYLSVRFFDLEVHITPTISVWAFVPATALVSAPGLGPLA
jgi:hypothetical protein